MSPDERSVAALVDRAMRRARVIGVAEAIVWGLLAGAASPWLGAATMAALGIWRWRSTTRANVIRALERAHQDARNLFVTAEELSGDTLVARPDVRSRVFADAAACARQIDVGAAFSLRPLLRGCALAGVAWSLVLAVALWRGSRGRDHSLDAVRPAAQAAAVSASALSVTAVVQPPAYTGLAATTTVDPQQLTAVDGSDLLLSVASTAAGVSVDHDGANDPLARAADGHFVDRIRLTRTGYVLVTGTDGGRRLMPVVVSPDGLPAVRITAPGRDLVFAGGNPQITFNARATDDFGVRSLSLHYTKVSGSGEQFEFTEGEIPLRIATANARDWSGSASTSLGALNLKDGDMLVYRAVASDARPSGGTASSDAFFIEISRLGAAAADGFTVQEEETRYALSQQMLIVKTERLNKARASMAAGEVTDTARNLAVEQRMIRSEFVFMLGGEIEDEEVEAQQSTDLQEGRLQNRGQRDLRTATIAMSQAEKLLTDVNIPEALAAEHAAVTALQRAFSRDRYILRAMATRSQLDATRRLTGNLDGAADWHRVPQDVPENRRLARLTDLLGGIAELSRDGEASPAAAFRQRALVLSEEAVRIDAASESLRQAATQLQQAADSSQDPAARSHRLAAAADAATREVRRAQADAVLASSVIAPGLSGAFADAIRKGATANSARPEQERGR